MPHITITAPFPGVTGPLEERLDTGEAIRDVTQELLRGPSPLSELEREIIATVTSYGNKCRFCSAAHAAVVDAYAGSTEITDAIRAGTPPPGLRPVMYPLLTLTEAVRASPQGATDELVAAARAAGATDLEIHDTVLVTGLFCFYNRYVDGLATDYPKSDDYYLQLAARLTTMGYHRPDRKPATPPQDA
jgi:uncharacterized peroxidase-related enzyme